MLGKRYPDTGVEQGRAVLADLARHPATARHIAQKLARHFVADEPPPSLVDKLEKAFKDTDGNLKEVAKTLVSADESWTPQRSKLKPPSEWIVGVAPIPSAGVLSIGRVMGAQATLGEALWRPLAPNGYPDTEAAWIDGVPRRFDVATFAGRLAPTTSIRRRCSTAHSARSPLPKPRDDRRAESRPQALALLVMTPEFLRR